MAEYDDVVGALKYIDPKELNYQEWLEIGMAIKAGGQPVELWDEWSANDPDRYHYGECARKWKSFNDEGITASTLFKRAHDNGYQSEYRSYDNQPARALDYDSVIGEDTGAIIDLTWTEREEFREPVTETWDYKKDTIDYLKAVFRENEYVGYVMEAYQDDKDGKWKPNSKGNYARTAGQIVKELEKKPFNEVFGDYNKDAGIWIRFNPLDGTGVKNDNVTKFRYALVESDTMDLGMQTAIIKKLQLPCAALVYSGSKSVHAIVHIDANDIEEYKKRVDNLYSICQKNGLKIDQQNKNPSRLSRLPGVLRGNHKQFLIDTNIGLATYLEWEEYIDSISDDLPDPESLDEVWDTVPDLAPELIEGVLRQGHKFLIAGPSKAGKSFALIELCIAIAEGSEWLGMKCAQGKVLYVNLELDRASCLHRFQDVYDQLGYKKPTKRNIVVWNLRGKSCPMDKLAPKLIRRAQKDNYMAVVIDPIYKVITGDENSAEQMSKFCNQFDKVATELNCAVIYCHHHSKGVQSAKRSMDRASGSGVFARDPDAMMDIIELPVPEVIQNRHKQDMIGIAYGNVIRRYNRDYFNHIDKDDFTDAQKMFAHVKKALGKTFSEDWILSEASKAENEALQHTAWRLEFTLREFPNPGKRNVWFEYPIHMGDDRLLKDLEPETELPPWQRAEKARKSPERKKEIKQSQLEIAFANVVGEGTDRVKLDDLMNQLNISKRTLQRRIEESNGRFTIEKVEGTKQYEVQIHEDYEAENS